MDQSFSSPGNANQTPPKNWLVESILVTIFCCMPFGIAGIVFAAQVNSKIASGDYAGAIRASQDAAKWTKIGFFLGLASIVITLIFTFGFGGWALFHRNYSNY